MESSKDEPGRSSQPSAPVPAKPVSVNLHDDDSPGIGMELGPETIEDVTIDPMNLIVTAVFNAREMKHSVTVCGEPTDQQLVFYPPHGTSVASLSMCSANPSVLVCAVQIEPESSREKLIQQGKLVSGRNANGEPELAIPCARSSPYEYVVLMNDGNRILFVAKVIVDRI